MNDAYHLGGQAILTAWFAYQIWTLDHRIFSVAHFFILKTCFLPPSTGFLSIKTCSSVNLKHDLAATKLSIYVEYRTNMHIGSNGR